MTAEEADRVVRENPQQVLDLVTKMVAKFPPMLYQVDDLCNSVYLHLLDKALAKYDGSTKLSTYIGVVAKQFILNEIASYKQRKHNEARFADLSIKETHDDLTHKDNEMHIADRLLSTDELTRRIAKLRYSDDLSIKQIAAETGVSRAGVNRTLEYVLDVVRKDLME